MLAVISPIPLLSSPSIPLTHDATQPALPSPECPALTTSLSAIASSESSELATAIVDANGTLEVVARNNGNTLSETNSDTNGTLTSETIFCVVRESFVRGGCVMVVVRGGCVIVVVGVVVMGGMDGMV
jgi:hypothetical protein